MWHILQFTFSPTLPSGNPYWWETLSEGFSRCPHVALHWKNHAGKNQINIFSMTRPVEKKFIHQRIHSGDYLTNAMNGKNLYSGLTSHQSSDNLYWTGHSRCNECVKAFVLCLKLSVHQILHTWTFSEYCKVSSYCSFITRYQNTYPGRKPHKCNVCGKKCKGFHQVSTPLV